MTLSAKHFARLLLLLLCGLRLAHGAEHRHGTTDGALPEAPEKVEIVQFCTACHGIERVQNSGGTDVIWQDRIQRMIRWGAKIPQERISAVAAYLAKALPLRPRPAASLTYFANTAVSEVSQQEIQRTLRLAAHATPDGLLRVNVESDAVALLRAGQRARVFAVNARATMIPASIVRLVRREREYEAILQTSRPMGSADSRTAGYLAEVVVSEGRFLAIPNDAIIEDGDHRQVYVQDAAGEYLPRTVQLGIQGDQATQVLAGLRSGEQVVTLGSFFIDAEHKMNLAD